MRAIALKLMVIWGWRRVAVCLVAGAASAMAMEPLSLLPVLFVTVPVLVWTLDGVHAQSGTRARAVRAGFVAGMFFGLGYFVAGLHWVGSAFFVDADAHAWLMVPVLLSLTLLLALFWGAACASAVAFWTPGIARLLLLAAALATTEWLRGTVFSGFPWNTPGLAVAGSDQLAQVAGLVGLSGLNLLVVLTAGAPALLADEPSRRVPRGYGNWLASAALVGLLGCLWGFGQYTLGLAVPPRDETVRIRIVQPNIPQTQKWDPAYRSGIFASYLELSDRATSPEVSGIKDVDVLIWPESAPPFLLERHSDALASIAALLPEGATLLTGALRIEENDSEGDDEDAARRHVFNSVLAVNADGEIIARYDKFHLVPFGEYLPFESHLARLGIRKLVEVPGSFSAGPAARTISVPNVPLFSPLICYEIIFAGSVVDHDARPQWILNVTNDAWFGDSSGPRQHLQQARFRAIEQGLPVLRAANTGISAVIDARGRVWDHKAVGVDGVIDTVLPGATPAPVYARYGDWMLVLLIVCALAAGIVLRQRRPVKSARVNPYEEAGAAQR